MRFADRRDAGRRLAERLGRPPSGAAGADDRPVVLGMARGGIPVAAEIAAALAAPLDVIVVRKVGCPWQPELGVGAVVEGGTLVLDTELIRELGLARSDIEPVIERERVELERRVARYRGDRAPADVAGRDVILVDDGLATGGTARAAVQALRGRGARRIVLAVPVAPPETVRRLRSIVDDLVVVATPDWFAAIGEWYVDFGQVSDGEVVETLAAAGAAEASRAAARAATTQRSP